VRHVTARATICTTEVTLCPSDHALSRNVRLSGDISRERSKVRLANANAICVVCRQNAALGGAPFGPLMLSSKWRVAIIVRSSLSKAMRPFASSNHLFRVTSTESESRGTAYSARVNDAGVRNGWSAFMKREDSRRIGFRFRRGCMLRDALHKKQCKRPSATRRRAVADRSLEYTYGASNRDDPCLPDSAAQRIWRLSTCFRARSSRQPRNGQYRAPYLLSAVTHSVQDLGTLGMTRKPSTSSDSQPMLFLHAPNEFGRIFEGSGHLRRRCDK
jgi:hypothetical protein